MVETIVPVVHGTRTWLISLLLFTAGAVATAALLGLALGAALPAGGAGWAGAVAALALVEAAAEVGLVRLRVPQVRRQVPERWRERYPQPLAALLYGGGLGLGFATYLPVATLPVVAVGVAALAGPAAGAVVLGAFGLGRGLALAVATVRVRSHEQATERIEWMSRLAGKRRLRSANAVALAVLGSALALGAGVGTAKAATRLDLGPDPVADPSAGSHVLAFDRVNSDGSLTGVVRYHGTFTDLPGDTPDIDGSDVVVDTGSSFEILDYTTMTVVRTLPLSGRDPALSSHWLVYRHTSSSSREIILYDLNTDTSKVIAHSRKKVDLGAPDIDYPRVVFHRTGATRSSIDVYRIDHRRTRRALTTVSSAYSDPSIDGVRIVYVHQSIYDMQVDVRNLKSHRTHQIYTLGKGGRRFLWTTGINDRHSLFTVYTDTDSWIDRG